FGTLQRRPIGDQPGRDLTWSPDGKWLAYQVASNSGATLYVTAVDRLSLQYYFVTPRLRRIAWTPDSKQLVYETLDRSDLYLATLQPITVQRLVGSLVVVSPRGRFPGPPVNGEFYPPIVSLVQQ
ncbi:MAG: hypothetical protein ABI874_05845, partial [Chloroflexota bacterium]